MSINNKKKLRYLVQNTEITIVVFKLDLFCDTNNEKTKNQWVENLEIRFGQQKDKLNF